MSQTKVRAIRFEQRGRVFYTVVMPAADAIEYSRVDEWDSLKQGETAGYQRAPSGPRVRAIASFLGKADSIMPVGGLLNARAKEEGSYGAVLEFEPDDGEHGAVQKGMLVIPPDARPLWIVDMQHRLKGFEYAIGANGRTDLEDFPVTFTIADGLSKLEEVGQFEIINTTQKKVRTDLARRLMAIQARDSGKRRDLDRVGRLWEARGSQVAEWLNRSGSVWKGRIIPPNSNKAEVPNGIVRETSFVTSLKPILQAPLFRNMPEDQVAMVVERFWQAVKETFPDAFVRAEDNVIQKTPGIFSLHMLAPEIIEQVRTRGREISADSVAEIMMPWRERDPEYWAVDNEEGAAIYGSMKGFARLAADLRDELPETDYTALL